MRQNSLDNEGTTSSHPKRSKTFLSGAHRSEHAAPNKRKQYDGLLTECIGDANNDENAIENFCSGKEVFSLTNDVIASIEKCLKEFTNFLKDDHELHSSSTPNLKTSAKKIGLSDLTDEQLQQHAKSFMEHFQYVTAVTGTNSGVRLFSVKQKLV